MTRMPHNLVCNHPDWRWRYDDHNSVYMIERCNRSGWSKDVWETVYTITRETLHFNKLDCYRLELFTVDGERVAAEIKRDFQTDTLMLWIPPTERWGGSGFYAPSLGTQTGGHLTINKMRIEGGFGPILHDAGVTVQNCTVIGNRVTKHMRWLDDQVEAVCKEARYHDE
jgi:hypothetical protein